MVRILALARRLPYKKPQRPLRNLSLKRKQGMRAYFCDFCRDERGSVLATEWVFVASILTLGTIAGLLALQATNEKAPDWPTALTR